MDTKTLQLIEMDTLTRKLKNQEPSDFLSDWRKFKNFLEKNWDYYRIWRGFECNE